MAKVLVSFLGKGRTKDGSRDYSETTYQFENGKLKLTKFFGIALQEVVNPDKTVIFGTSGSMWDVFLADSAQKQDSNIDLEDKWLLLIDSVEKNSVTQAELNDLAGSVSPQSGHKFAFQLMSSAISLPEQIKLVHNLMEAVKEGDELFIDVTHSFRHLPMLSMMAAMLLKSLKNVTISGIFYGALEMTEHKITPVLNLKGLLEIQDWIVGLKLLEETGSIHSLKAALKNDLSNESTNELEKIDFSERIMQLGWASQRLGNVHRDLAEPKADASVLSLVQAELCQMTSWFKEQSLAKKQASRAWHYLNHRDYLRSVIFAMECCISLGVPEEHKNSFEARDRMKDKLCNKFPRFRELNHLRNTLAHAANPEKNEKKPGHPNKQPKPNPIPDLLKDEQKLALWLNKSYQELTSNSIMPKLAVQGGNK